MDQTLRYAAVVAGGGLAGCLLLFALPVRQGGNAAPAEAVVVTLPPSRADEHKPAPVPRPAVNPAIAQKGPASIGRQLQMELKRVGCYEGAINGHWNAATRQAMKTFTDRVNAKLPVERPDPILLALVQGHREPACVPSCAEGQHAGDDGRCLPQAAVIQEATVSAETTKPAPVEARPPASSAGTAAVAAAAVVSAAVPASGAVRPPAPRAASPTPPPPPAAEPQRPPRSEDMGARPATSERRTRHVKRKYPSIQMVFRKLQRAAINALPLP